MMSNSLEYSPHYTVDDYRHWDGDWELWEGIAIAMSPSPFGRHQLALTELAGLLRNAIRDTNCDANTLVELDWIVSEDTVVRPDVIVVCGNAPEHYLQHAPAIAVEVLSDSTRKNDLGYKRRLYQEQGVLAYIIVDPHAQTIVLDRLQSDGSYQTEAVTGTIALRICDDCTLQFSVETLLGG